MDIRLRDPGSAYPGCVEQFNHFHIVFTYAKMQTFSFQVSFQECNSRLDENYKAATLVFVWKKRYYFAVHVEPFVFKFLVRG